jgi:isoquinoline 1-oxidoreductase subunit beta
MTVSIRASEISRRGVLKGALAGGFVFAFHLPVRGESDGTPGPGPGGVQLAPNAFIRIDQDGNITLVMPQVEMGQGIYTGLAMILAEELDADFARLTLQHAPPDEKLYSNPLLGIQATGGSTSVRAFWSPLRKAGAVTRATLVQAAALQWKVLPATCKTSSGMVYHPETGRSTGYGQLVDTARTLSPPNEVALKDPKDFVLIGKPLKRFDTPDKVTGKTVYGIDSILPGMKFATLAQCPVAGGKIARVDDAAARKMTGVRQIIVLDDVVAVVGDHMWAAKTGLDALAVTWSEGPNATLSSEEIWNHLRAASEMDGVVAKSTGDVSRAFLMGDKHEAAYELPFLAHATMEPLNCTVHVTAESCDVWVGTQIIGRARSVAAEAAELAEDKVTIHQHLIGGGFGRRLEVDMIATAVRIGKEVEGPVKIVWTREEDIRHDLYRPIYRDNITAAISAGKVIGLKYRVTGSSVIARWLPPAFKDGIDIDAVDSAVDMPYDIPNFHVEYVRAEPPAVPTGFWRGVGPNNNVFAIESFMDELAAKAGKDPIVFRREMLVGAPRIRNVLDLVAEKSGWGQSLPARVGRGVCVQPSFGTSIATVVEAEVDRAGSVLLHRVTLAVDCGVMVNPDSVVAQLQGGLIFGLTAALYGEITVKNGRIQQSNFHDYRMLRMDDVPKIDIHVVRSGEVPGGIGEAGVVGGPPALRNAIYAATGVALRRLPIERGLIAEKRSW